MITVAKSSINGPLAGGVGNASGDHAGRRHNGVDVNNPFSFVPNFPAYTSGPNSGQKAVVFDPYPAGTGVDGIPYSGNNKIWQDIIPPFTSDGVYYSGLNWTPVGRAVYFGADGRSGYCKKMSPGAYVASERLAAVEDPYIPGLSDGNSPSQIDDAIRDDLQDQGAEGDGTITDSTDLDALPNDPLPPAGPTVPGTKIEELQADLTDYPTTHSDAITQAIAGVVWYDDDRDGVQAGSETAATEVGVILIDPSTGDQYTEVTVYTDSDGYFEFPSLPAGDWEVRVVTPDGYSYTYDSSGLADGRMPETNVPEGGIGFAWAGLAREADPDSGSENGLASTGANEDIILLGATLGIAFLVAGISLTVFRRRA